MKWVLSAQHSLFLTFSYVWEKCGGIWLLVGAHCGHVALSDQGVMSGELLRLTKPVWWSWINRPKAAAYQKLTFTCSACDLQLKDFKTQLQHMLNCGRWRTQWHNGRLGLWLFDQASGAGGLWSGKDHLPSQVYRQQVQPQVHDHSGHWLQRKTSGEWWRGCLDANVNVLPTVWRMEIRSMGNAFV